MAKKLIQPFAQSTSAVDQVVAVWLKRHGIDPDDLAEYRIRRPAGEPSTIELVVFFDDTDLTEPGKEE